MTMQIGIVAEDGIVLASDIWTHAEVTDEIRAAARTCPVWKGEPVSKIEISRGASGIAVSRAHDLQQARLVSDAIISNLSEEYWEDPVKRLREIASDALSPHPHYKGSTCLVALMKPLPHIFKDSVLQRSSHS